MNAVTEYIPSMEAINRVTKLSPDELALVFDCCTSLELKKGQAVLKQGEVCRSFYCVEKGYLRTWYDKDGHPINLNFTFEGEFAADMKSFRSKLAKIVVYGCLISICYPNAWPGTR
jgi:CRP-like cAMP-binding protein